MLIPSFFVRISDIPRDFLLVSEIGKQILGGSNVVFSPLGYISYRGVNQNRAQDVLQFIGDDIVRIGHKIYLDRQLIINWEV